MTLSEGGSGEDGDGPPLTDRERLGNRPVTGDPVGVSHKEFRVGEEPIPAETIVQKPPIIKRIKRFIIRGLFPY